jgi:4-hydroxy-2-oxoheptanedioate aldolase
MRRSRTLEKLRNNEVVRILSLGHYIPSYVHIATHFGFDTIWLDLEHKYLDDAEVQALLGRFHLCDIDAMVRPSTLEKSKLCRYLEEGASGLMIPHVSTREKANMIVDSVKFPPLGDRGIDPGAFDNDYNLGSGDYVEHANRETFVVLQIETPQAVENADAIAAVEGVDALFIGLADLGLRLGNNQQSLEQAIETIAAAARNRGIAWGCPTFTEEQMRQRANQGAQLLAAGSETMALKQVCGEWRQMLDAATRSNG